MNPPVRTFVVRLLVLFVFAMTLFCARPADAYSVLSHEEVVDMAWKTTIIPMLKSRFPGISDDDLRQAHAYAYGGSVIQDLGYYPFGSHYFSDLLHYVRPAEFVATLIRDSTTPNEYAFALGALAHFSGDIIGHPAINQVTADENPTLAHLFGHSVTYAESPTAHIRTEFGFDVVEVAQGHYSQENYRDFVGFQVSKVLMERAFLETYGIQMNTVLTHEDLAIATYRRAVSSLIPNITKVAFVTYKKQIEQATPGTDKNKFLYRLNQTEYAREFGTDYTHVSFPGRMLALLLRILPKAGPLKALKVTIPDAKQQDLYLKSINTTVDRFKLYLGEIRAAPAPLPPPDPRNAIEARKAADKMSKDANKIAKLAEKTVDPDDKARKEKVAGNVRKVAAAADATATRTEEKADKAQAAMDAGEAIPRSRGELAADHVITPPTAPKLPDLDLDTGKPSTVGEYRLADRTYAHLLDDLVKRAANAKAPASAMSPDMQPSVPAGVAAAIEKFFAHPVLHTGPPPSPREAASQQALARRIEVGLARLRTMQIAPTATGPATGR